MPEEYVNPMRAERMKGPSVPKPSITSSNESSATPEPSFKDAGDFLRGGGKVDGEMENIGSITAIPKGTPTPGKPNVEKGAPGPQGPGVI